MSDQKRTFRRVGVLEVDPLQGLSYTERLAKAREDFNIPHGTKIKLFVNAKREELVLVEV